MTTPDREGEGSEPLPTEMRVLVEGPCFGSDKVKLESQTSGTLIP